MIQTVDTRDFSMRYIKFGSGGRVLAVIPGLSVKSVLMSEDQITAAYDVFARDFTVYLFDRRLGMPENYTIRDMAADTAAAMKALGIERADVFGVSQGGMIAQFIAIDHPELVHRLVLGSTSPHAVRTVAPVPREKAREAALSFLSGLYSDDFIKKAAPGFDPTDVELTEEELDRFAVSLRASDGFDAYGELGGIKCPTLVIGAIGDKIIPPQGSLDIALALGCELYMYGAPYGHAVYDEAPDYKNRIYSFLMRD